MKTEFFLGANSAGGFYSLYDEYYREKGGFFRLIKAGPGGGKSGFMRRIGQEAERLGYETEYILCSGDPGSLDAVYITDLGLGYTDATSPHAAEPSVFGVSSDYVNLGIFCGRADSPGIREYTRMYKAEYSRAYAYLKAAAYVKEAGIYADIDSDVEKKVRRRALSAVKRELGSRKSAHGSCAKRFIRCLSCSGEFVLTDTVQKLCKLIYSVDDRFGLEQIYFDELIKNIGGERVILCPSPLRPALYDAVLLPDRALGFVSSSLLSGVETWRHVRLDAMISPELSGVHRNEKLFRELMNSAFSCLASAKSYHDQLENEYRPYIDFDALTEFTEKELQRIT